MIIKVNDVVLPDPAVFVVDITDLEGDSTTRNARGDLIRDKIATKFKITCEWPPLSMEEIKIILEATNESFFQLTFPDPMLGTINTKTFYVDNRQMPLLKKISENYISENYIWEGLKINFLER